MVVYTTFTVRPTTRADRYLTMKFHSDYVIARTGYLIHYNVTEGFTQTCQNQTCNLSCSLGYRTDFAGCIICDCVTTTTTSVPTSKFFFLIDRCRMYNETYTTRMCIGCNLCIILN